MATIELIFLFMNLLPFIVTLAYFASLSISPSRSSLSPVSFIQPNAAVMNYSAADRIIDTSKEDWSRVKAILEVPKDSNQVNRYDSHHDKSHRDGNLDESNCDNSKSNNDVSLVEKTSDWIGTVGGKAVYVLSTVAGNKAPAAAITYFKPAAKVSAERACNVVVNNNNNLIEIL